MNNQTLFTTKEQLARFAIEYFLTHNRLPTVDKHQLPPTYWPMKACFVTLYIDGQLRGCIGDYQPSQPLYQNIIKNAVHAAVSDPRFLPLTKSELNRVTIEVSVLSPLTQFKPESLKALIDYLKKNRPGVLLEASGRKALFLPQVWKQLPHPQEFLSELTLKAGIHYDAWKDPATKFWVFSLE